MVYAFLGRDVPVFLLGLFAKNERITLSKAELNELAKVLGDLAESYREGTRRHVKGRRKTDSRR